MFKALSTAYSFLVLSGFFTLSYPEVLREVIKSPDFSGTLLCPSISCDFALVFQHEMPRKG